MKIPSLHENNMVIRRFLHVCMLLSPLFMLSSVEAADDQFCQRYAATSVHQFKMASEAGIPNLTFPVWSNDYNGHYIWCLKVSEQEVRKGIDQRDQIIKGHRNASAGKNVPGQLAPMTGGPFNRPGGAVAGSGSGSSSPSPTPGGAGGKEAFCADYAKTALDQLREGQSLGVPNLVPPVWNPDYNGHHLWCTLVSEQDVRNATAQRQQILDQHRAGTTKDQSGGVSTGSSGPSTKKLAYCEAYAMAAVQQYEEAQSMGIPNLQPPSWTDDHQTHVDWCLQVKEFLLGAESLRRQQKISNYRKRLGATRSPPYPSANDPGGSSAGAGTVSESPAYPYGQPAGAAPPHHGQVEATPVPIPGRPRPACEGAGALMASIHERSSGVKSTPDSGFLNYLALRTGDRFQYKMTAKGKENWICLTVVEKSSTSLGDTYQLEASLWGEEQIRSKLIVGASVVSVTDLVVVKRNGQIKKVPFTIVFSQAALPLAPGAELSFSAAVDEKLQISERATIESTSSEVSVAGLVISEVMKVALNVKRQEELTAPFEVTLYMAKGIGPVRAMFTVNNELLHFELSGDNN